MSCKLDLWYCLGFEYFGCVMWCNESFIFEGGGGFLFFCFIFFMIVFILGIGGWFMER